MKIEDGKPHHGWLRHKLPLSVFYKKVHTRKNTSQLFYQFLAAVFGLQEVGQQPPTTANYVTTHFLPR